MLEKYGKTALYFGGKDAVEKGLMENIKREIFRKNLRSREEFEACAETVMRSLFEKSHALREAVFKIFDDYQETRRAMQQIEQASGSSRAAAALGREIRDELEALVPKDFLDVYSLDRLIHIPRYLEALRIRLARGKVDYEKDRKKAEQARPFLDALRRMDSSDIAQTGRSRQKAPEDSAERKKLIDEYRWMVEEFKVSLFAPELKTAFPVSPKRLSQKILEIQKGKG